MIHIYCGDGKGKSTAGIGLCVRAAGAGKKVLFYQFLKTNTSSERKVLEGIQGITVAKGYRVSKFVSGMSKEEKHELKMNYMKEISDLEEYAEGFDLIVLDEILYAIGLAVAEETQVEALLTRYPDKEWILTGRYRGGSLLEMADYVSCITKEKHPFDHGISARKGIEY